MIIVLKCYNIHRFDMQFEETFVLKTADAIGRNKLRRIFSSVACFFACNKQKRFRFFFFFFQNMCLNCLLRRIMSVDIAAKFV